MGISCGWDDSAYVYEFEGKAWQRRLESEQNTYAKDRYKPQWIESVQISSDFQTKRLLILTLGRETWCASNWHDVYYRLWSVTPNAPPKLLLDQSEWAFVAADPPINGTIRGDDLFVEYAVGALDPGLTREAVYHFRVEGDGMKRVNPVALSPKDFAHEWLTSSWEQAKGWSESVALQRAHDADREAGESIDPTKHCGNRPDLWQVAIDFHPAWYFLIRWRPPYNFTMVQAGARPFPGCTIDDSSADEIRTLFADWKPGG
jgi:hypothetical protein